jgi:hypothetical protein
MHDFLHAFPRVGTSNDPDALCCPIRTTCEVDVWGASVMNSMRLTNLTKSVLAPALLLSALAVVGAGIVDGSREHASAQTTSSAIDLQVVLVDYYFGEETYRLTCSPPSISKPPSGTPPNPQAICAAIAREPALVLGRPAIPPGCPAHVQRDEVRVSGRYKGKTVATIIGPCRTYQQPQLGELWFSFFPAADMVNQVRVNKGVGPLSLGNSRSAVQALLGTGRKGPGSLVFYPSIGHTGVKSVYGVGYDHKGRVATLLSTSTWLTLNRLSIGTNDASERRELNSLLNGWTAVDCGGVKARANHGHGSTTIIGTGMKPIVIISKTPRRTCLAARRL